MEQIQRRQLTNTTHNTTLMAKIYTTPKEVPLPVSDYENYDSDAEQKKEDAFLEKLRSWLRENSPENDPLIGEIVMVGRGDGYAQYMMCGIKPFAMMHLPLGDAWRGDPVWERGLRITDARKQIQRRKLPSPFGSSK